MDKFSSNSTSGRISTYDLIIRSANSATEFQREDGSFPAGRNYTYDEQETPVRTTSQWLETLTKAYIITSEAKFKQAANHAVDYLLQDNLRPHGYTYNCRSARADDRCNGLVGQAAPIRALSLAGDIFEREDAKETAKEVFLLHPFNKELALWECVEITGELLSFDRTLNHQIIFAAAASQLTPELDIATSQIKCFLDNLDKNMGIYPNGLIKHYVRPPMSKVLKNFIRSPRYYNMLINEIMYHYYSYSKDRRKKERGYQTVNLVLLSKLHSTFPSHDFWKSDELANSLKFLRTNEDDLLDRINTKHGDLLIGIGIAKIRYYLENESIENIRYLVKKEVSIDDAQNNEIFDIDHIDKNTKKALVSTLVDLPDVELYYDD